MDLQPFGISADLLSDSSRSEQRSNATGSGNDLGRRSLERKDEAPFQASQEELVSQEVQNVGAAGTDSLNGRAWASALERTRRRLPGSFDQWFSGVQLDELTADELSLTARDEFVRDWVKVHFLPTLVGELEEELGVTSPGHFVVKWRVSRELDSPIATVARAARRSIEELPRADEVARGDVSRGETAHDPNMPVRLPASTVTGFGAASSSASVAARGSMESSSISAGETLQPREERGRFATRIDSRGAESGVRPRSEPPSQLRARVVMTANGDPLNPKYTFSNFVVGPSNELAYAAAAASAGGGGRRYNPLFLCGGTGLGKTHLMHAIAHRVLETRPDACVIYVSAERFTNEFIEALQHHKMEEFRSRYRKACDLLLLDDIQFLAGREQTQEEFFHTFNSLHDADKPIVVSSDKYPQDLQRMPERLISRFTSGLVADVHVPALETRVAIVKKKAELEKIAVSDEVAVMLAQAIKSNVRELEGALIRLAAKSSLVGRPIDEEFAHSEIMSVAPRRPEVQSVEDIQRAVCHHFRLSNSELLSKDRHKSVAFARQVAMYLCRQRLKCSFPELGRAFGNRDHTTVMSAVRRVEALRQKDPQVNAHLEAIVQKLASGD